jgi:hypothetical protein
MMHCRGAMVLVLEARVVRRECFVYISMCCEKISQVHTAIQDGGKKIKES